MSRVCRSCYTKCIRVYAMAFALARRETAYRGQECGAEKCDSLTRCLLSQFVPILVLLVLTCIDVAAEAMSIWDAGYGLVDCQAASGSNSERTFPLPPFAGDRFSFSGQFAMDALSHRSVCMRALQGPHLRWLAQRCVCMQSQSRWP
eukprot:2875871-Pleurochrysis_carterae.AAC.2